MNIEKMGKSSDTEAEMDGKLSESEAGINQAANWRAEKREESVLELNFFIDFLPRTLVRYFSCVIFLLAAASLAASLAGFLIATYAFWLRPKPRQKPLVDAGSLRCLIYIYFFGVFFFSANAFYPFVFAEEASAT